MNNRTLPPAVNTLVLTGEAWKGEKCLENNIVNAIYPEDELLPKTLEFAKEMAGKVRDNYKSLKFDVKKSLADMWDSGEIK